MLSHFVVQLQEKTDPSLTQLQAKRQFRKIPQTTSSRQTLVTVIKPISPTGRSEAFTRNLQTVLPPDAGEHAAELHQQATLKVTAADHHIQDTQEEDNMAKKLREDVIRQSSLLAENYIGMNRQN